jgi:hypothetical protein
MGSSFPSDSTTTDRIQRVDAIVLKVNQSSVRVRVFGESSDITFRSSDAIDLVPAHIVILLDGPILNDTAEIALSGQSPLSWLTLDCGRLNSMSGKPFRNTTSSS